MRCPRSHLRICKRFDFETEFAIRKCWARNCDLFRTKSGYVRRRARSRRTCAPFCPTDRRWNCTADFTFVDTGSNHAGPGLPFGLLSALREPEHGSGPPGTTGKRWLSIMLPQFAANHCIRAEMRCTAWRRIGAGPG
jgi:hypothetical protein